MTKVTIHLDKKLLRDIKLAAKLLNITLSEFVNRAIKHKLQELENDRQI